MKNISLFEEFQSKSPRYTDDEIENVIRSFHNLWKYINVDYEKAKVEVVYRSEIKEIEDYENGFTFEIDDWYIETDEAIEFDVDSIIKTIKTGFDKIRTETVDLDDLISDLGDTGFDGDVKYATWPEIEKAIIKVLNTGSNKSSLVSGVETPNFEYTTDAELNGGNLVVTMYISGYNSDDLDLDYSQLSDYVLDEIFYSR
jgi:hypothetical protein